MNGLQRLQTWWVGWWARLRRHAPQTSASATIRLPVLPAPLQACATVAIPALNEAAHIGDVVR